MKKAQSVLMSGQLNNLSGNRLYRYISLFALILCQLLPYGRASGQIIEYTTPTTDTLEKVVVTGQFRPQPEDRSIYRIETIDASEISIKAANNLGELLKTQPGFQLRSDGVLGDFIRIRGLTGEHVKILIDGMPVTGRVADRIDLSQLTMENVDHIEIIEGPMSVVYGSNALAGAINIITRDFKEGAWRIGADGYAESAGTWNFSTNAARRFGDHTLNLHGARNFFKGWGPVDTSRYRTWKPKLQYIAGAGYTYRKGNLKANVYSDYLNEELRDNGALTIANLYEKALDAYHFTSRWNNRLNIIYTNSDDFVVNFQSGYSYYEKRKITYLNDLVNLRKEIADDADLHDTTNFSLLSARGFVSNIPGRSLEYQAGFDINHESAGGKRTGGNRSLNDVSGFLNFIVKPAENFRIQPGLRIMRHSGFKSPLVYGISFDFKPAGFVFKGSYARGFRAPSLKQLYLRFIDSNHEIQGNPDLKPEMADNISVSADYTMFIDRHMLGAGASFFYNDIRDAVQLALSLKQPGWGKYFNVGGKYRTKGFEAGVSYRYSPGFSIKAAISGTGRLRLDNRNDYYWSADFTASGNWSIAKYGLQLGLFYKYNDEYLEFAGNYNPEGELEGIVQQRTSGYHMLDFTLLKGMFNNSITISGGVKNILNIKQINSTGNIDIHGSLQNSFSAAYGRSVFFGLSFNLTKKGGE